MKSWKEKFEESEEFKQLDSNMKFRLTETVFKMLPFYSETRIYMENERRKLIRQIKSMRRIIAESKQKSETIKKAVDKLDQISQEN